MWLMTCMPLDFAFILPQKSHLGCLYAAVHFCKMTALHILCCVSVGRIQTNTVFSPDTTYFNMKDCFVLTHPQAVSAADYKTV